MLYRFRSLPSTPWLIASVVGQALSYFHWFLCYCCYETFNCEFSVMKGLVAHLVNLHHHFACYPTLIREVQTVQHLSIFAQFSPAWCVSAWHLSWLSQWSHHLRARGGVTVRTRIEHSGCLSMNHFHHLNPSCTLFLLTLGPDQISWPSELA